MTVHPAANVHREGADATPSDPALMRPPLRSPPEGQADRHDPAVRRAEAGLWGYRLGSLELTRPLVRYFFFFFFFFFFKKKKKNCCGRREVK